MRKALLKSHELSCFQNMDRLMKLNFRKSLFGGGLDRWPFKVVCEKSFAQLFQNVKSLLGFKPQKNSEKTDYTDKLHFGKSFFGGGSHC